MVKGDGTIKGRDTMVGYHCPYCGMSILNRINIFSMDGNLIKMKCVCGGSELIVQMLKDNKFRLTVPCILCPNSHSFTLSSGTFFQKDLFAFSCKFTAINICFIGKGNRVYEALKINEEELIQTFAAYEEELKNELGDADGDDFGFDDEDDEYDDYGDEDDIDEFGDFDFEYETKEPGFTLYKNPGFSSDSGEVQTDRSDNAGAKRDEMENIKVNSYQIVSQILDSISALYNRRKIHCKCGNFDGKIVILGNAIHIECKNCGSYRGIKAANISDAEYMIDIGELYLDFDN